MEPTPPETLIGKANLEGSHKPDPACPLTRVSSRKRSASPLEFEEKVSSFKRVRLLATKQRLRRATGLSPCPAPPPNRPYILSTKTRTNKALQQNPFHNVPRPSSLPGDKWARATSRKAPGPRLGRKEVFSSKVRGKKTDQSWSLGRPEIRRLKSSDLIVRLGSHRFGEFDIAKY